MWNIDKNISLLLRKGLKKADLVDVIEERILND